MPRINGRFFWYDLDTTDIKGASTFYPKLTGWTIQKWENASPERPYSMWINGEEPTAARS